MGSPVNNRIPYMGDNSGTTLLTKPVICDSGGVMQLKEVKEITTN